MFEGIIAIATLICAVAGIALPEIAGSSGSKIKAKIENLAKKIYTDIANDQKALDKIQTAYQEKNSAIANAIFNQAGFGPAIVALQKEYKNNLDKMRAEKSKVTDAMTKHQNDYNQLTNAGYQAGTSFSGNKYAESVYDQVSQGVDGGIVTREQPVINGWDNKGEPTYGPIKL